MLRFWLFLFRFFCFGKESFGRKILVKRRKRIEIFKSYVFDNFFTRVFSARMKVYRYGIPYSTTST